MKCSCCERENRELRFGICFDCAECETVIATGLDMYDNPVPTVEGYSPYMGRVKFIAKKFLNNEK